MSQTAATSSEHGGYAADPRTVAVRGPDGDWTAPLPVPRGNSFFFDHPLDHVSGMLIVCGMLDLVDAVVDEPIDSGRHRLLMQLSFPRMASSDEETLLAVTPDDATPGRFGLCSSQADTVTAEGTLHRVDGISSAVPGSHHAHPGRPRRCPAELVNRARKDNVLVGAPEPDGAGLSLHMLPPPADHYLSGFGTGGYSARGMIEASRQFSTMLVHKAAGRPLDNRIIWLGFSADLPCAPPASCGYRLLWRPEPLRGSRITMNVELLDGCADTVLGSFRHQAMSVSPAAYQRFRSSQRTERQGK